MPSDPNTDQNQRLTRAQVVLLVVTVGYLWIVSIRELFAPFVR